MPYMVTFTQPVKLLLVALVQLRLLLKQCPELNFLLQHNAIESYALENVSWLSEVLAAREKALRATSNLRRYRTPLVQNVAVLIETRRIAHMQVWGLLSIFVWT
jgi:hypothetical protein